MQDNLNRSDETAPEPRLLLRFTLYLTLGILWALMIFGLLIITYIYQIGSRHSYIGDQVDEITWTVLIAAVAAYTLVASAYLGIKGYRAQYSMVTIINIVLIAAFILAVIIQAVLIFSVHGR